MNQDVFLDYHSKIAALRKEEKTFALATIVKVEGSASAKVGSKAIFDETGKNVFGWIGGGCAERFVGEQSVQALSERKGRVILADLDDEIFGLGVACGGKMEVFIDPIIPQEVISINAHSDLKPIAERLAHAYGIRIHFAVDDSLAAGTLAELFLQISNKLSQLRKRTSKSLRVLKDLPATFGPLRKGPIASVSILGRGRIVEALDRHFSMLGIKTVLIPNESLNNLKFSSGQLVVIASHSSRDPSFVKEAIVQGAAYIAMIGSRKRALEVINALGLQAGADVDTPLFLPAGLDIDAQNPEEIALSIVCEFITEGGGSWI